MKSILLIILSFFLATAILAPSIIVLYGIDTDTDIVLDFGEEEENKEVNEKDFLFSFDFEAFTVLDTITNKVSSFYQEKSYSFLKSILLPPPKYMD